MSQYYINVTAAVILSIAMGAAWTAFLVVAERWRERQRAALPLSEDRELWSRKGVQTPSGAMVTLIVGSVIGASCVTTGVARSLATIREFSMSGEGALTGVSVGHQEVLLAEMAGRG